MWNRKAAVAGLTMAAAAFAGACADSAPTEPSALGDASAEMFRTTAPRGELENTLDAAFMRIANDLPGFGGLFYDEAGRLNIYMTGASQARSASQLAAAMAGHLSALRIDPSAQQVVVRQGQYDFVQLNAIHRQVTPVLGIGGVVFTDADEAVNRVRIGVEHATAESDVRNALQVLGVPSEAVVISRTEPIQLNQTLQSRVRPVAGGLQINFTRGTSGFVCTLGFNVRSPQAPNVHGFVTNSHCSDTRGTVIPTPYWQHSRNVADTYIGEEAWDLPYFQGGVCPEGRNCRYSDALGVRYQPGVDNAFGRIYKTVEPGAPGTLTIDPVNPRWNIVDEIPFPVVGQVLHKTGRTSGWTLGPVASTCSNSNVSGDGNFTMLCQDRISTTSAGGDSGSPYFERIGETLDVRLIGIHWGSGGGTTVMSAMSNIRFENQGQGGWITYPGQTPPPPAGPR
jgi:hypothetical protein